MRSLIIFSALVIFGSCIPLDRNDFRHFTSDLINENSIENSQQESRVNEENKIGSEEPPRNGVLHAEETDVSDKEEHPDYSDVETINQHTPQDQPESTCPLTSSFINVQPRFLPIIPLPPKVSHDVHPHLHLTKYKSNLPYYFGLPRLSPLEALPPVHSTYIHGLRPLDEARYDEDEIYSENSLQMPNNVRIQRTLVGAARDDYHDLLAQLEHDAVMPNILPTMAVRYSENLNQYAPEAVTFEDAVALFPQSVSVSAIPILLSCAPQVDSGVMANQLESMVEGSYRSEGNNVTPE